MRKESVYLVFRFVLTAAVLCFTLRYAVKKWDREQSPEIYEVAFTDKHFSGVPEGAVTLRLKGSGLMHVNTLRVDERRVPLLHSESLGYSECYLSVASDLLHPGTSYGIQVGKRYPFPFGEFYRSNEYIFDVINE